jgi:hypothetical protein
MTGILPKLPSDAYPVAAGEKVELGWHGFGRHRRASAGRTRMVVRRVDAAPEVDSMAAQWLAKG